MRSATIATGAVTLLLCVASLTVAQETPTERASAREVVNRLDSLEQSLNLPALVARLTGPNASRDQVVARAKQLMDTDLLALGDDITRRSHPDGIAIDFLAEQIL